MQFVPAWTRTHLNLYAKYKNKAIKTSSYFEVYVLTLNNRKEERIRNEEVKEDISELTRGEKEEGERRRLKDTEEEEKIDRRTRGR